MAIDVLLDGEAVPIDEAVFRTLLDNSVAGTYKDYENALDSRRIKFSDLVRLADKGDIPYSLFFAPLALVQEQVKKKTEKLLAGLSKDTFSIGSRAKVELRDVELIVKDLIRKQQLVRKHDKSLQRNKIVGLLRDDRSSVEADAARLMTAIGLSHEEVRACRSKEKALDLMIGRLEANQVLVSRSVQHYMPQRLTHVRFSGMTIRDNKVPFIFLAGGDHGDDQEPAGRTIFTLALLTVLVARRKFAPMTWDGGSAYTDPGREYDIAGAMLMPRERFKAIGPTSLDDMRIASDEFKVTMSAVAVRAMRLGMINAETTGNYLAQLREEFQRLPKGGPRSQILPENAVRKYNGRELSRRMLHALDSQSISPGEFCRAVCLNYLKPSQIEDLRRALG
ncbi:ImmA/IrrE family metallo-endopeptidase [Paenarthrobacter nitroguajacolicus]|uniref:ImmA/IrrE family metallo-endopeptidase n=1 Tax=Paenarthrobacter nitroguajacolicus TaxID=211146 RepID=UPI003D1A5E0A